MSQSTANLALSLPLMVPLTAAIASVLLWRKRTAQIAVGLAGGVAALIAAVWLLALCDARGVLVMHLGGWPAPAGIAFVADRFAALMVLLGAMVALAGAAFAVPTLGGRLRWFMPLLHFLLAAMGGFFLAGDIFNLYVWFELILVSSFGLLLLDEKRAAVEGAVKYFAINIAGSMLLLSGIAMLYAMTGTLNMAHIAVRLEEIGRPNLVSAVSALFLVAMGIKGAAFPLFFWLPASYHTPPLAVIAVFGGMLTKIGIYGMARLFTLLFTQEVAYTHTLILIASGFTMVAGVLGAVAQEDLRRLLSFHIISQIGYMLLGIGLHTAAGLRAMIYFMIHIVVAKTALFLVAGVVYRLEGSFKLDRLGGLYAARPALAALFLLPALSLGGMPPFSGFAAKLSVVQAGLEAGEYALVGTALGVGLLTLYSMSKIWTKAFWSPRPLDATVRGPLWAGPAALAWAGPLVLAALTVAIGLAAGPLLHFADRASRDMLDRAVYVRAVLGDADAEALVRAEASAGRPGGDR